MPPKNCVTGAAAQWQNGRKSVRRRRRRMENRRTFLSVAHTKCPSGNNWLKSPLIKCEEFVTEVANLVRIIGVIGNTIPTVELLDVYGRAAGNGLNIYRRHSL